MFQEVVHHITKKVTDFMTRFHEVLEQSSKCTYVKVTELIEIKALIGLRYLRAALQLNIFKTREIIFFESSHKIFAATMIYNRFSFLMRFLESGI